MFPATARIGARYAIVLPAARGWLVQHLLHPSHDGSPPLA
jgi:hypothetical protein